MYSLNEKQSIYICKCNIRQVITAKANGSRARGRQQARTFCNCHSKLSKELSDQNKYSNIQPV
jgi:hypothetical protein